jgi:hypothetical protein
LSGEAEQWSDKRLALWRLADLAGALLSRDGARRKKSTKRRPPA